MEPSRDGGKGTAETSRHVIPRKVGLVTLADAKSCHCSPLSAERFVSNGITEFLGAVLLFTPPRCREIQQLTNTSSTFNGKQARLECM